MAKQGGSSRPRFRLLPTVLLTAAILALPTVVYGWGRSSSSFAIDKVVVSGTRLVPERSVLRLLRKDYLGRNLFTVTTKDVRASLALFCYISDARVDRDFPRTLRVSVEEHRPAVYALAGGRWYVVADDGQVICEEKRPQGEASVVAATEATASVTAADAAAGLPVPTGKAARLLGALQAGPPGATLRLPRLTADGPVAAGSTPASSSIHAALPVVVGLPRALRARLAVVEVAPEGQLTLRFARGPVVIWGRAERARAKTLALRVVLERYESAHQDCAFVDVSTPDRVLARPLLK